METKSYDTMRKSVWYYLKLVIILIVITGCNNQSSTGINQTEMKTEYTTLINSFQVPNEKLEESIAYWEACRDFLETQPGYISTKLHQSLTDNARFRLVNIARWETPQAFLEASAKMKNKLGLAPVEGLKPNASLYTVIRE